MDFDRETLALLKEHGAKLVRNRKHRVYRLPDGRTHVMGSSWSDQFAAENNYYDLLKLLGISREVIKNPERRRKPGIKHRQDKVWRIGPDWNSVWAGDVFYKTASGWGFAVFNDCDEWDYIDHVISPSGITLEFDDIWDRCIELQNFMPTCDWYRNAEVAA